MSIICINNRVNKAVAETGNTSEIGIYERTLKKLLASSRLCFFPPCRRKQLLRCVDGFVRAGNLVCGMHRHGECDRHFQDNGINGKVIPSSTI